MYVYILLYHVLHYIQATADHHHALVVVEYVTTVNCTSRSSDGQYKHDVHGTIKYFNLILDTSLANVLLGTSINTLVLSLVPFII